jgi:hypothetical protein
MPPLIRFTTPPEGVPVVRERGCQVFRLAVHVKLSGAVIKRTARCTSCGAVEEI